MSMPRRSSTKLQRRDWARLFPSGKRSGLDYYALALRNVSDGDFAHENDTVLSLLRKGFNVEECALV